MTFEERIKEDMKRYRKASKDEFEENGYSSYHLFCTGIIYGLRTALITYRKMNKIRR